MIGSAQIAAWTAQVVFWGLLVYGWAQRELGLRSIVVFTVLWIIGWVGLPFIPYSPAAGLFPSFVAVLDIALVFMIFKGDVRLT